MGWLKGIELFTYRGQWLTTYALKRRGLKKIWQNDDKQAFLFWRITPDPQQGFIKLCFSMIVYYECSGVGYYDDSLIACYLVIFDAKLAVNFMINLYLYFIDNRSLNNFKRIQNRIGTIFGTHGN